MGFDPISIGLVLAGVSAIVGVAGQVAASNQSGQAATAQRSANQVAAAQSQVNNANTQRQAVREERIRRARILAASSNGGTAGSSGEAGATSALSSNLASGYSTSAGQSVTNTAINGFNQQAQDYNQNAQFISGITGGIQNGLDRFSSIFDQKTKATDADIFGG